MGGKYFGKKKQLNIEFMRFLGEGVFGFFPPRQGVGFVFAI